MGFIKFHFGDKEIAFNAEFAASKTLAEFKEHEKHHGLTHKQYKEVHDACRKIVSPEKPKEQENQQE